MFLPSNITYIKISALFIDRNHKFVDLTSHLITLSLAQKISDFLEKIHKIFLKQ